LHYLAKNNQPARAALEPIMLRAFAASIGRKFIKGHGIGDRLFPEKP
jgi:hypothetical protein